MESLQGVAKPVVIHIWTRAVADAIGGTNGFLISDVPQGLPQDLPFLLTQIQSQHLLGEAQTPNVTWLHQLTQKEEWINHKGAPDSPPSTKARGEQDPGR